MSLFAGGPGGTRTRDLRLAKPTTTDEPRQPTNPMKEPVEKGFDFDTNLTKRCPRCGGPNMIVVRPDFSSVGSGECWDCGFCWKEEA